MAEKRAQDPGQKEEEKTLKVDINEISRKTIREARNALEFMTISISKHFKVSPQQTLNLFLDSNKYLSHLLAKGVKSSFEPVHALLNESRGLAEFIVTNLLSLDEEQNVKFLLNALRTCLISRDFETAELYCCFLIEVYDQYRLGGLSLQAVRQWVATEGINTLFFSIKKHPLLLGSIITICYNYLDDEFFQHIRLSEKSILWTTEKEKFIFYKQFITEAAPEIIEKFAISGQFEEWNRLMVRTMKKSKDQQEWLLMIAVMEEQWNKLGSKFEQSDLGLATIFLNFVKGVLTDPSIGELLFVQATRTMFSLMQSLGSVKNPFAPLIYKLLVGSFGQLTDRTRVRW